MSPPPQSQPSKKQLKQLRDLFFTNNFVHELPGDPLTPLGTKPQNTPLPPPPSNTSSTQSLDAQPPDPSRTSRTVRAACYSIVPPDPSHNPALLAISTSTFQLLDLDPDEHTTPSFTAHFTGSTPFPAPPPTPAAPVQLLQNPSWSHAYGSHQYGFYAGQLGDGRAISLFQLFNSKNELWEVQLKSSGPTPYSRFGDGRVPLRSSIREFLACEYMAALGVPTVRALGVWASGRSVYREKVETEGLLVRVTPTFVRFGSFELFHYRSEREMVKVLADYVIRHHFPDCIDSETEDGDGGEADQVAPLRQTGVHRPAGGRRMSIFSRVQAESEDPLAGPLTSRRAASASRRERRVNEETGAIVDIEMNKYARFFQEIIRRTAHLIAHWQAVGFVHGSMNTDDMSILGLTLDYGPFCFLDTYNPFYVANAADQNGRYRFEHQPKVATWNLSKMGRTLAHLLVPDIIPQTTHNPQGSAPTVKGEDVVRELLREFEPAFIEKYTELMRKKLGLRTTLETDLDQLILPLLQLMADVCVDYTLFFRALCHFRCAPANFNAQVFFDPAKYEASKDPSLPAPKPRLTDPLSLLICAGLNLHRMIAGDKNAPAYSEAEGEGNMESSLNGAFGKVDATVSGRRRSLGSDMRDAAEDVPALQDIADQWKDWAEKYRDRIVNEVPAPAKGAPAVNMDLEDIKRVNVMKKANPKYALRNWICDETVRTVQGEIGKKGPIADVQKALREGSVAGDRGVVGSKALERVMRVLVRDVWGEQAESATGWKDDEDRKAAERWSGMPPEVYSPIVDDTFWNDSEPEPSLH
ncbi:hypothetical protein HK097_009275 [Rhizophlyctis rosea]|uniref:Selenoprotein O n=1 Tax=Rhizophlyctis rosea TaxID=64517 RepID=A0AAD5X6L6_9FUNG|nr:hypothetical protein HK097_009275 [Rhizophlyctis rosea]